MSQRVLILDDEPVIANTLEAILRTNGYEAKAVYSAEQALELIVEWRPAFAIVDVILPRLNGIEFSKVLRAQLPACGLVLISGETSTGELLEQAEKDGHRFEVVAKPIHPSVLLEKVAEMLACTRDQPAELPLNQTAASKVVPGGTAKHDSQDVTATPVSPQSPE